MITQNDYALGFQQTANAESRASSKVLFTRRSFLSTASFGCTAPGSTKDNPIEAAIGEAITCSDATITITERHDSDTKDSHYIGVGATLDYQGSTKALFERSIEASFLFDGGYSYDASLFKKVSIDKQCSTDKRYVEPLEKCDLGIGSTISSDTYQQLSSPVLLIQIGRSIGSESTGGGKYYRIALS
ncbi:hypothetical protein [uncultured Senegalimassilia sp.]|uniref:hypothetical protein n=1 Tax=uncultured Senegalimassilia sp. TaxID=1714350 RepID=UPI0026750FF9|nr:hypothetical protein [uncultured Senegalimassilia sp.]